MPGGERQARKDTIFRRANEQIRAARDALPLAGDPVPFICECEDETCTEIIRVPLGEYEAVRASDDQFVIVPGHRHLGELVAERDGYDVVRRGGS